MPLPYDAAHDTLYRIYLLATIVGVAGAFIGLVVLTCQTILLRRSVTAVMNSERARVDVDLTQIGDTGNYSVTVTNHGKSVATMLNYTFVHSSYPIGVSDMSGESAVRRFQDGLPFNHLLPPGPFKQILKFDVGMFLTPEEKAGEHKGVFSASVMYLDIYEEDHETEVVYSYDELRKRLENVPRYNR
jgi:uncharacterized repeat protein (TIGR01451 family)